MRVKNNDAGPLLQVQGITTGSNHTSPVNVNTQLGHRIHSLLKPCIQGTQL